MGKVTTLNITCWGCTFGCTTSALAVESRHPEDLSWWFHTVHNFASACN